MFLGEDAEGFHVDHIVPYSKGGATDITNAQLIPARVNLRKGASMFELRQWQKEATVAWAANKPGRPFMLVAVPAGGKTYLSLHVAREWMEAGRDRRLLVVVPTSNLQEQWRDEAAQLGIQLQTVDFCSDATFKHGFRGGAVTYSFVAMNSAFFKRMTKAPTMVIFDEVHHCGDDKNWGAAIKDAFDGASEKLLLSGTPFRTDGRSIPYVEYDESGFCKADYTFDYIRALRDEVIRHVSFEYSQGSYTGHNGSERVKYQLNSEVSKDDASSRLQHILKPRGSFVSEVVRLAHQRLMKTRETIKDAGALAVCIDQSHAKAVAETIRDVTGCEPALIVSDKELSNSSVNQVRNSRREWVVAVRQVAEGTDIKRLQVLCYFSNWVSDMFFRQVVGRVQRRKGKPDLHAYVFLPSDPRLIECAEQIENMQVQALKLQDEETAREKASEPASRPDLPQFICFDTEHDGVEFTMIGATRYSAEDYQVILRIAEAGECSLEKAAKIFLAMREPQRTVENVVPLEIEMKRLRVKINRCIKDIIRVTDEDYNDAHQKYRPKPFKPLGKLGKDELEYTLEYVEARRDGVLRRTAGRS